MFVLCPVVAATVLVTIGYFAMWVSVQGSTPKGLSIFGKVMSIVLFVMAGLVILFCLTCGPKGVMRKLSCPGAYYMHGGKKKMCEMHKKGGKSYKEYKKKHSGKVSEEIKESK